MSIVCPALGELATWSLGYIPDPRAEAIDRHVNDCRICLAALETVGDQPDGIVDLARTMPATDSLIDEPECRHMVEQVARIWKGLEPTTEAEVDPRVLRSTLGPGSRIGPYEILAPIGRGAMGIVYRARHPLLNREVALKMFPTERIGDPTAVTRFLREVESLGRLNHPNIVQASDAGVVDGRPYLVMELVQGTDLSCLVRSLGPLPIPLACRIAEQVAQGLSYIHSQGLVHRDIKPSNIMLASNGHVRVLDLGLSRVRESSGESLNLDTLTEPGLLIGTPEYMAPEQIVDPHSVDIRADMYSLGCTLYYLLTGQPPFKSARRMATVMSHLNDRPRGVRALRPDVPSKLAGLVTRLLAKNPAKRFSTPAELMLALQRFTHGFDLPEFAPCLTESDPKLSGKDSQPSEFQHPGTRKGRFAQAFNLERFTIVVLVALLLYLLMIIEYYDWIRDTCVAIQIEWLHEEAKKPIPGMVVSGLQTTPRDPPPPSPPTHNRSIDVP